MGVAGYGVVGKRRSQCIANNPNVKLAAVCDKNFSDSGYFKNGVAYYQDYKKLLNEDLDIIFVCLTNDIAPLVVIEALKKGAHVFCEKPPGRNVEDIERVIECNQQFSQLKLMYGFNHRYHDSVQDALKFLNSGEFGRVINIRGVYGKSKLITFDQSDWRVRREIAGGGVLLDQGIHMVDLMRLFAGEFEKVHSFISNSFWGYDVEDNAYAIMRTKSGIVAMLNSSATQWRHRFNLEINLEKGSLILGGILSGSKSYGDETLKIVYANTDGKGDPRENTTRYNSDPSWEKEVNGFIDCIMNDKPITFGSAEDALATMQLVFKIYAADLEWKKRYQIDG